MHVHRSFVTDRRAVSDVVAVALLIGVVLLGVSVIVLTAGAELGNSQAAVEVSQAERSLTQFDSAAERVATASTSTQRVDLGLRGNMGTLDVEPDTGSITVEHVDFAGDGNTTEVVNTTMGTVVYENGDATVGYQGGGVWRSDGDGSVLVSPPEFTFNGKTLKMQVIETERGGSVHTDVQLTRSSAPRERFPDAEKDLENKLEGSSIRITIQSRYYRAWGQFFEDDANTIVQYDHENQEIVVLFLALPEDFSPEAGIIATSGPGEIRLEGTGAYVDSYNSSIGPYENTSDNQGKVIAAGDVITKGDSQIDGDVVSGKDIFVDSNSKIDGNASAKGTITVDGDGEITGDTDTINSVTNIPPINSLVEDEVEKLSDPANNDNEETTVIQGNEIAEEGTLDSGSYYLDNLDLQGETLVLDTSDGNITIAVRDWVNLEKSGGDNSHIVVEGDGQVRFFVASEDEVEANVPGSGKRPVNFFVERNGSVEVDDDESLRFQVFGPDDFVGAIGGSSSESAEVTATFIAPAGEKGAGEFYVQHGDLYGAVTTGNLTLGQYGQVHFDRALVGEKIPLAPKTPRVEFVYITEHEIEVEES